MYSLFHTLCIKKVFLDSLLKVLVMINTFSIEEPIISLSCLTNTESIILRSLVFCTLLLVCSGLELFRKIIGPLNTK